MSTPLSPDGTPGADTLAAAGAPSRPGTPAVDDVLVEDVSIDGMCGVY